MSNNKLASTLSSVRRCGFDKIEKRGMKKSGKKERLNEQKHIRTFTLKFDIEKNEIKGEREKNREKRMF